MANLLILVQNLNNKDLIELYNFLKLEDEIIYKFYLTGKIESNFKSKKILNLLVSLNCDGGESLFHERIAPLFQDYNYNQELSQVRFYMNF